MGRYSCRFSRHHKLLIFGREVVARSSLAMKSARKSANSLENIAEIAQNNFLYPSTAITDHYQIYLLVKKQEKTGDICMWLHCNLRCLHVLVRHLGLFIENDWKELETTGKDYNILETTENDLNRLEMTGNDVSTRFHLFPLLWKIIFLPIFTE